ncbi:hypothetical protein BDN72DRAFT_893385 [Pluteus cervinus]|uniref:Uncharacterized protein n=1 Tax=Pluteus cervinus TaxID=181527 RepID=A0ACD3B911_9AGAR|nr:hypothetical protein BDN72DRAFT_893385 [Pluteus cervinus]
MARGTRPGALTRHILYTLYSSGADESFVPCTYDFTCCDIEPAVLGGQKHSFVQLVDAPATSIWNVFFYLRLDAESYHTFIRQCQNLVEYAEDLSSYSPMRQNYSPMHQIDARSKFKELQKAGFKVATELRCAGLLAFESFKIVPKHYWKKGVSPCKPSDLGPNALKPSAPLSFHVIDTSNRIGLLNVLIGAAPLLSRTPSSALFTEAILSSASRFNNNSPSEAKFGLSRMTLFHYARATCAGLLKFIKDRTSTDWTVVMDRVTDLMMNDETSVMGMNNFQDLCCQLRIRGVHTVDHIDFSLRQFLHAAGLDMKMRFRRSYALL